MKFSPVVFVLSLLLALPVEAGTDSWSVVGQPPGGLVSKVVVNPASPSILYAATQNGVYESTDSSASWKLVFPTMNPVADVAIEPEKPSTLYTGYSGGIYTSTDGGATWAVSNKGIGTQPGGAVDNINYLSVDPVTDGIAYATGNSTGIYKTTDGGKSWATIDTGLTSVLGEQNGGFAQLGAVTVDPVSTQVLYLPVWVIGSGGPTNLGVYKSVDGGAQWTYLSSLAVAATAVIIDPNDHTHLFALAASGISDTLYTSPDSGTTWNPVSGFTGLAFSMVIDPTNSLHMVAGLFVSGISVTTDGGSTWTPVALGNDSSVTGLAIDPVTPSHVYAADSPHGVYKSTDGGATWASSNSGIYANYLMQSMVMGGDGVIYAASYGGGVFKSADHGATWAVVNNGFTPSGGIIDVTSLAEDPKTPTTVYAGTSQDLFKTTDGGKNWSPLVNGITDTFTVSVAVDPENSSTVYDGTSTGGLFKSVDGGGTWSPASTDLPSDEITAIAVDPTDSMSVYAGTATHGLYHSADGGGSWKNSFPSNGVVVVAVDPSNHENVFISVSSGDVYKSADGGTSWTDTGLGAAAQHYEAASLLFDPADTSTVYATVPGYKTTPFVSTNGGSTSWTSLSGGLPTQPYPVTITAMVLDPKHPTNLYGAGSDGQIYAYNNTPVPSTPPPPSSGSSGGGSGGGGGAFGWLSLLLLLAAGFVRKHRWLPRVADSYMLS